MADPSKPAAPRAYALDALRGLAILTMCLSGVIPWNSLPAWMYHAQTPPPTKAYDATVAGLTWVDLVFPYFLFALGAAIPLALGRRLRKAGSPWRLVPSVIERTAMLLAFAFYYQAIRPWVMNDEPTTLTWILALLGFALLFPMYMRFPDSWAPALRWGLRIGGWAGAVALLALIPYPGGRGISLWRSDIIIILLAWAYFGAALIWLFTRERPWLRLGLLVILFGLKMSSDAPGWIHEFWSWTPAPWVFHFGYFSYLFLVVPATLIGDRLVEWLESPDISSAPQPAAAWSRERLWGLAGLALAIHVVLLVGLQARWVFAATAASFALMALGAWMTRAAAAPRDQWLRNLYLWGTFWLIVGLCFEPYQGGIKKDGPTFSYFFVTCGSAIYLLIALTAVIDILRVERPFRLLIQSGQNPMIAYAGIQNLVLAALSLTGLMGLLEKITPGPWPGVLRGVFITFLLALAVSVFTRFRIFWRA